MQKTSRKTKNLSKFLTMTVPSLAAAVAGVLSTQSAMAASGTWSATPTNGNWEAAGAENNWSTGAATFPGATSGTTNTDTATFSGPSTSSTIAINATTSNALPLNVRSIVLGVTNATTTVGYTVGTVGGNSLWLSSTGSITVGNNTGSAAQTVNAPITLQPGSSTTAGTYSFVNNTGSGTQHLIFGGSITGGSTTQGIALTLDGGTGASGNTVNGNISNGAATLGVSITKNGAGTWALGGNNSYTGGTTINGGVLRFGSAAAIGGSGANVTVNSGAAATAGYAIDQAFLSRIVTTSSGSAALGASSSNNLDLTAFGSLSLGATGTVDYTGTLTPSGSTYRLGGGGGTLGIVNANAITGPRDLVVNGSTVQFRASQNYNGSTTINSGTLDLRGAGAVGSILNTTSPIVVNPTGTLLLTNDNTNGVNTNRIADSTAVTLVNGNFSFGASTAASTVFSETIAQLNIVGSGRIVTTAATGAGSSSTLTITTFNRTAGTALTFGTTSNLGTSNANRIFFGNTQTTDAAGLLGGWATAGSSDFAGYDGINGAKVATNVGNTVENTWASGQNVKITAGQTLTGNRVLNSLVANTGAGGIGLNLGGFTLRVESGGVLGTQSANGNTTISNGNLTAGSGVDTAGELFLMDSQASTRPITITANIVDNGVGAVSLVTNGNVNNSSASVVIVSGALSYTGTTSVAGGETRLGNTLTNNKALSVATGATLQLGGLTHTVDGLSGGGTIGVLNTAAGGASNSSLSVGNSNGNATFTGSLTSSGLTTRDLDLVKNGTGTQIIAGTDLRNLTSTTTGSGASVTTINNGTLQFAKQVSLYNSDSSRWISSLITVNSGATLALNVGGAGEFTSANVDTLKALGTASAGFTNGSKLGLDTTNAGGNFNYSSIISNTNAGANAIGLVKLGTGTLTLASTGNSFSGGATINGGTLNINSVWQLGGGVYGGLTFGATGGTLQYATTLLNGATDITQDTSDGGLGVNGVAKNVTLTGNAVVDTNGQNVSFKNTFGNSGLGGFTKTGAGTLTMNGGATYAGATSVSAGTLLINGNHSAATGNVSVASGATLGGSGTVGGATTISNGGTLSPGNSPGLLTFSSSLTLAGSTNFEINGTARGSDYDAIDVAGSLTNGGALNLAFGGTLANGTTLDLFGGAGGNSNFNNAVNFASLTGTGSYAAGTFAYSSVTDSWSKTVGSQVLTFSESTGDLSIVSAATASISLTGTVAHDNVATGDQITVMGSNGNYISEIDELDTAAATVGSAPVVTIGGEVGTNYVMLWTTGNETTIAGLNTNGGTIVTSGAIYNQLDAAYDGWDILISYANFSGAKVVNFDLTGAGVTIDKIAVVPEPASFGLAAVAGLGLLNSRRRRKSR